MRGKHRAKPQLASYLNVDARDFIKETPYQKFANNLKALMKKKGLKQVHIVTALGVPNGSVSSWCNGKNLPRAETANRLAAFLEVSVSDLLGEDLPKKARYSSPVVNGADYAEKTVYFDENGFPHILQTNKPLYAKWVGIHPLENGLFFIATCSHCMVSERQEAFLEKPLLKKFCPECGAKMLQP